MKTNEERLQEIINPAYHHTALAESVLRIMKEAQEEYAAAFLKWVEKEYCWLEAMKNLSKLELNGAWVHKSNEILKYGSDFYYSGLITNKGKTTHQLIEEFNAHLEEQRKGEGK